MNRNKGVQRLSLFTIFMTLTVLACQGVSALNPFATATPTPTLTFTATPTVTPSPTPTSTPTFTPTATPPPTGRLTEEQPDGTTLFTDYDGKYQVTFPEGWTVVILDEEYIDAALDRLPEQERGVADMIKSVKNADVNELIRVVGFNFGAQEGPYAPNINISYDTNPLSARISLKDLIDSTVAYFPSLNIEVVNTEIKATSSGIEIGVIEARWSMNATGGQRINLHQKQVFFKSGKGVVIITFSTVKGAAVDLSADLEEIIESIKLLN
ncbi:MAG: hypothetical protein JW730_19610 [Anaerolineales bacterium]|nr:hypothetical protein [Anaerolineales bacterium]